jgi:LacI family transcriptional regulator
MAVTMQDVADEAGVSLKTVSRVVNREDSVAESTRQTVLDTIAALGFVPDISARRLSKRRSMTIGMVFSYAGESISSQYSGLALEKAMDVCEKHDYAVMPYKLQSVKNRRLGEFFKGSHVDGFVIDTPASADGNILQQLKTYKIPYVVIQPDNPLLLDSQASMVMLDDRGGTKEMTQYLLGLGHRHIGFVSGAMGQRIVQERIAGYQEALNEAGIPPRSELLHEGTGLNPFQEGSKGATQLVSNNSELTAIVSDSDYTATGVIQTLLRAGFRIPDDISVAGFDDIPIAALTYPPLTTMHQPVGQIVEKAVEFLLQKIAKPDSEPNSITFKARLVVRETSGAVRPTAEAANRAANTTDEDQLDR